MRSFHDRISVLMLAIFFLSAVGQTQDKTSVDDIISGAAEQRKAYINEFKNLMSEEKKTFEIYNKHGEVKKKRSVQSIFIVYQLIKDDRSVAEYRNVISVDQKKLGDADKRAQDFFEEIVKVDSSKKELEKLDKEGSRYDEEVSLNGLTLFQSVAIAENMRPLFEFKLDGNEKLGEHDVYAISYRQIKESVYISTDPKNAASDRKLTLVYDVDFDGNRNVNGRLRGKFWIDTITLQVWKELRVMTIQPSGFTTPVVFAENTFEYGPSDFGMLTPKKLTYMQYKIDKKTKEARKEASVTFYYTNFTKPDVEVKSSEVKN